MKLVKKTKKEYIYTFYKDDALIAVGYIIACFTNIKEAKLFAKQYYKDIDCTIHKAEIKLIK